MTTAGREGAIVNIASILAFRVAKQVPAYVAAKAGLVKLTEALALELAPHRIRVNARTGLCRDRSESRVPTLARGRDDRQAHPLRRFAQPADLDAALLLLASDAGAYLTGTTIVVDGGHGLSWL